WRRISGLSLRRPQVLVIRFQDLGRAPPRAPHVSGLASLQDLLDLHVLRVGPHDPLFRRIVPDKQGQMSCSNAPFLAGCAASVITARWWRSRRPRTKMLSGPTASARASSESKLGLSTE